jgi:hypothetical protein
MKFKELMENPPSKGSGQIGARYLLKDYYNSKSISMLASKKIKLKKIYITKDDKVIIHLKNKSESVTNLEYDIVFYLFDGDKNKSLSNFEAKIFSNGIEFAFTYFRAFYTQKNIIDELLPLVEKEYYEESKVRNPTNSQGFSKSIHLTYYALKFIIGSEVSINSLLINKGNLIETKLTTNEVFSLLLKDIPSLKSKYEEYLDKKFEKSKPILKKSKTTNLKKSVVKKTK